MNITFPTRPGAHQPGTPLRAVACRCIGGSLIIGQADTCLGCGHYEASTIDATWRDRALAFESNRRREKPELAEAA